MMKAKTLASMCHHILKKRMAIVLSLFVSVQFALVAHAESNASLMKKAVDEYRKGNFEEASGHFYATLTTDFSNATVHYYMASCYVHLKDHESACREFRIAYALSPDSDVGYYAKTALKYFRMKPDGTTIGMTRQLDPAASSAPDGDAKKLPAGANAVPAAPQPTVLSKSAELIQTQAQKEKSSRLEQSQKLADQINAQGEDRVNKTITAAGGSASSDAKEREQQMLHLPDDVKTVLNRLKSDYDTRREKQLDAGRSQAAKLDESAANLQNLIEQHHSVEAAGSNLYVRNYSKDPSAHRTFQNQSKN